jgi:hypothetical protein
LGFIGLMVLLGASPAFASTYDVNLDGLTGTIVTDCDSCTLGVSDFTSWSFTGGGYSISGGLSGVSGSSSLPLSASSGVVTFDLNATESVEFSASNGYLLFEVYPGGEGEFYLEIYGAGDVIGEGSIGSPLTLAEAATPLPAALPLFASGLGAIGFVARRRKRKSAAALIAA